MMPSLDFAVVGAQPAKRAASPTLNFRLAITQGGEPVPIQSISLQCQIRIDAKKRIYKPEEQPHLTDLFGDPERWGETLHSLLWTHVNAGVPAFEDDCEIDLPVPCSFDFNVGATKYFHGLAYGKAPLLFLFSGSVFYRDASGSLAMDMISWEAEAKYRLPIEVWQDMMERYYPNRNWLCLNRQVFEALYEYKRHHGYTGFDEALTSLLPNANREAS